MTVRHRRVNRLESSASPVKTVEDDRPEEGWRRVAEVVDEAQSRVWSKTKGLSPLVQLSGVAVCYLIHSLTLSRGCLAFPVQLVPNDAGLFQSVGYDSLAGLAVVFLRGAHLMNRKRPKQDLPWSWSWKKPSKRRLMIVVTLLLAAYLGSGLASMAVDDLLYDAVEYDNLDISNAMHRSIQVLASHLTWVIAGAAVLRATVDGFFRKKKKQQWFRLKFKEDWALWAIGGYFFSWLAFNTADAFNTLILPEALRSGDEDGVVSQMLNTDDSSIAAMATGAIAPCLSAPWWEECVYRGFLLPALAAHTPLNFAIPASAVLFSAHHWTLSAALPLAVLGFIWALVYVQSRNLLVTILIHAMWNTRVFLGAFFGF